MKRERGTHPLEILDVEDLDARVDSQGVQDGVDVGRLDVRAHILLQPQHAPLRLEIPRVAPQHIAQSPHMRILCTTQDTKP